MIGNAAAVLFKQRPASTYEGKHRETRICELSLMMLHEL